MYTKVLQIKWIHSLHVLKYLQSQNRVTASTLEYMKIEQFYKGKYISM